MRDRDPHPSWLASWASARSDRERQRLELLLVGTSARTRDGLQAQCALRYVAALDAAATRMLDANIRVGERRVASRSTFRSPLAAWVD